MNNELSMTIRCILIRSGVELWVEAERAERLGKVLAVSGGPQFAEFDGRLINRSDVVGIFTPQDMEELTRRKNGQWKCNRGEWHDRKENCECMEQLRKEWREENRDMASSCGLCLGRGDVRDESSSEDFYRKRCSCQVDFGAWLKDWTSA